MLNGMLEVRFLWLSGRVKNCQFNCACVSGSLQTEAVRRARSTDSMNLSILKGLVEPRSPHFWLEPTLLNFEEKQGVA